MNSSPMLLGQQVNPSSCGRLACQLDAQKYWQSRMTTGGRVAPLPELTDLVALAKSLSD